MESSLQDKIVESPFVYSDGCRMQDCKSRPSICLQPFRPIITQLGYILHHTMTSARQGTL